AGGTAGEGAGGSRGGAGASGTGGSATADAASGAGGAADSAPAGRDATLDIAPASAGEGGSMVPSGPSACPELTGGWMQYTAAKDVQFEGGDSFCTYREKGGVEFFKMMKNPAGVIQRCEARVHNDYQTGRN